MNAREKESFRNKSRRKDNFFFRKVREMHRGGEGAFLTDYFTILEPQNPSIDNFNVVQKGRAVNIKALNL